MINCALRRYAFANISTDDKLVLMLFYFADTENIRNSYKQGLILRGSVKSMERMLFELLSKEPAANATASILGIESDSTACIKYGSENLSCGHLKHLLKRRFSENPYGSISELLEGEYIRRPAFGFPSRYDIGEREFDITTDDITTLPTDIWFSSYERNRDKVKKPYGRVIY